MILSGFLAWRTHMPVYCDRVLLGSCYARALQWAFDLHDGQVRKFLGRPGEHPVPYFSHLMAVSALVVESGGTENEGIAALLHDALEDGPDCLRRRRNAPKDKETLSALRNEIAGEIERNFGSEVLRLVEMCSEDSSIEDKASRKTDYLLAFSRAATGAQLVMLCDKLHNAESIIRESVPLGPTVWKKFSLGPVQTVAFYRRAYEAGLDSCSDLRARSVLSRLKRAVLELEELSHVEATC